MITEWFEIWEGRRGELNSDKATRRYERVFRAITDDTTDGPATLLEYAQLEGLLTTYQDANGTTDTGAVLRTTRFEQDAQNPFIWVIRCEFSSEPYDVQQHEGEEQDPLLRPPIWTLDETKFQKVMNRDVFGAPVANSAGAPFSPLPEIDDTRLVFAMERNELQPDWPTILAYRDAVNSDVVLGFGPGVFKISVKAQSQFENNVYYWKVTYTLEGRPYVTINGQVFSAWDHHLLDQGMYQLSNDTPPRPRVILDFTGNPVSEPTPLNGQGKAGLVWGVGAVTVTNGGFGFNVKNPPLVGFTGGGGSGAKAVAICGAAGSGNGPGSPIISIVVTSPGTGYTSAPTVIFTPDNEAAATASLAPTPAYLHYRGYNWLPFAALALPSTII